MKLKFKTKKDLCSMLECEFGIKRTARDIKILEYDKDGFVDSFSLKLGFHQVGVSWFCRNTGYLLNNNLTFRLNKV